MKFFRTVLRWILCSWCVCVSICEAQTDIWEHRAGGIAPHLSSSFTTVWTGKEVIVWGQGQGGRYNLVTDTWLPISTTNAPSGRNYCTAVWTGSEMIIWGGSGASGALNDGAKYNPLTDSWTPVTTNGAPLKRSNHTAVWTGKEMIIWGGTTNSVISGFLNSGARYDPVSDSWVPTIMSGAPSGRRDHTAVWTGKEMIIWGGRESLLSAPVESGALYDPVANVWRAMNSSSAPIGRISHTATWCDNDMIVWGGSAASGRLNDGARYNPVTDSWTATSFIGAPSARTGAVAVWTGTELLIWGGYGPLDGGGIDYLNSGFRYNPLRDEWHMITTNNAPVPLEYRCAVWTGKRMVIWGRQLYSVYGSYGGIYDPISDSWSDMAADFLMLRGSSAVWTGTDLILLAGDNWNSKVRFNPVTNTWTPLQTNGAPNALSERLVSHSEVWTGKEMIVWGAHGPTYENWGSRYEPMANSWSAVTTNGAPWARSGNSAVWTGSEMIIWGGRVYSWGSTVNYLGDGGRYNPSMDTWTPLPTNNAPAPREEQTVTWTGSEMIIWGGYNGDYLGDGRRYSPTADTWLPISQIGAPAARHGHSAIWTGKEMIIWGGANKDVWLGDGARYDPVHDIWKPVSNVGAPSRRTGHSAVWTGKDMIVWGGAGYPYARDGALYNPVSDSWRPMRIDDAPPARADHIAVWTGDEMIICGGEFYDYYEGYYHFLNDTYSYLPYGPFLRIVSESPAGRSVAWPYESAGFRLEESPTIGSSNWAIVSNSPVQIGAEWRINISPPRTGNQFFRLQKP